MKRIVNIFDKDEPRAGDRFAGPALYFDFPGAQVDLLSCRKVDEVDLDQYDLIILGGGGLFHIPFPGYDNGRFLFMEKFIPFAKKVVTWGLGHNVHGSACIEYPEFMNEFALNGVRDRGQVWPWVPGASCCHGAFSKKRRLQDGIRIFRRDDPDNIWPIPGEESRETMLDGHDQTFDEIVEFLGGAVFVITNSYHAAYWSLLLGRIVWIYQPMASKFLGLPGKLNWQRDYLQVLPEDGFLERCREKNIEYHKKVLELLG